MIYWQLQWHKHTHLFIVFIYSTLSLLLLLLHLPLWLDLILLCWTWYAYAKTCSLIKDKPLALIFNDTHWSAITRDGVMQLELINRIQMPLYSQLTFKQMSDEATVHTYNLFAMDINTSSATQAGTWRQLMAILNTLNVNTSDKNSILTLK